MMPKIDASDYPEIIRLYCEEKLSQAEIGLRFGVTGQCVSQCLRKSGVETRVGSSRVSRSQVEEQKRIAKLLYDAGASAHEIASILKLAPQTIHEHLVAMGYSPRERNEYGKKPKANAVRVEILLNLWKQGLSGKKIAKIIGVSSARVYQRLRKMPQYQVHDRLTLRDEEDLVAKISILSQEGKSRGDIATALGISYNTISRLCRCRKIPVKHAQYRENLTGKVFGSWKVLCSLGYKAKDGGYSSSQVTKDNSFYWECICLECKKVIQPVSASNLRGGRSKACLKCAAKMRSKKK